jgi:hypothetical protein
LKSQTVAPILKILFSQTIMTDDQLKAGHAPATKVAGMRVSNPSPSHVTPAKRDDATHTGETAGDHPAVDLDLDAQENHEHRLQLQQQHLQDLITHDQSLQAKDEAKKQFTNTKPAEKWHDTGNVKLNHGNLFQPRKNNYDGGKN